MKDSKTSTQKKAQQGGLRRVQQFYAVLEAMNIEPGTGEHRSEPATRCRDSRLALTVLHFPSLDVDLKPLSRGNEAVITTLLRNLHVCFGEELLIAAAAGPTMNLNSAPGGFELGELSVDEEVLAARCAVQAIETALQQKTRPATRQPSFQLLSEVTDFFPKYQKKLDAKGEKVNGKVASPELARAFAELLATPGEGAPDGLLALLLCSEVTMGALDGRTSYFGEPAGSGPSVYKNHEFWVNSQNRLVTHQSTAPRTTAFADFWSLCLKHALILNALVATLLACQIAMIDPDVIVSQSASLAWLSRQGWLAGGKECDGADVAALLEVESKKVDVDDDEEEEHEGEKEDAEDDGKGRLPAWKSIREKDL